MKDFANTLADLGSLIFSGKLPFLETIGIILVLIAMLAFLHFFMKVVTLDSSIKTIFGHFFKKGNVSKPKDERSPMTDMKQSTLVGIGGWLILPSITLVISPLRIGHFLYTEMWPIFSQGHWDTLTNPASHAYHRLWGPLLVFEVIGNLLVIVLGITALWFFMRRSHLAPKLVISWLVLGLVFIASDFFLSDLIPAVAKQADPSSAKELGRAIFGALIWIPYFMVSKRVKATFVH